MSANERFVLISKGKTAVTVDEKIKQALDLNHLALPTTIRVLRIEPEEYFDSSGEDALRLWVIMSDDVDVSQITGDDVLSLKSTIRRKLSDRQVDCFAYISLVTESEWEELRAEEERRA